MLNQIKKNQQQWKKKNENELIKWLEKVFDLDVDISIVLNMFCPNMFFRGWFEILVLKGRCPRSHYNNNNNNNNVNNNVNRSHSLNRNDLDYRTSTPYSLQQNTFPIFFTTGPLPHILYNRTLSPFSLLRDPFPIFFTTEPLPHILYYITSSPYSLLQNLFPIFFVTEPLPHILSVN